MHAGMQPADVNATDYIRDTWTGLIEVTLRPVSLACMAMYWAWQITISSGADAPNYHYTYSTTILSFVLLTVVWRNLTKRPRFALIVLQVGYILMAIGSSWLFGNLTPMLVVPMIGLVGTILLEVKLAWLGPVVSTVCVIAAHRMGLLANADPIGLLGWILSGAAIGVLLRRGLQTTIDWALSNHMRALDSMAEARERRGQMAKMVKELDMAYYRLSRLNSSLAEAWHRARDAEQHRAELVTTISHELRTPLNLILGFSEMIMTSPHSYGGEPIPPAYRSDVNAIFRASTHLLQLIEDVLDLSRADVGRLDLYREESHIEDVLTESLSLLKEYITTKGLDLRYSVEQGLPAVSLDRLRIRQVILNLLTNAARFTTKGFISIEAHAQDDAIVLSVQDSGHGMSEAELSHVFEQFSTLTRPSDQRWQRGTGLGLPISQRLVQLHGGRMWVESQVDRGTTFFFTLPISTPDQVSTWRYSGVSPVESHATPMVVLATKNPATERRVRRLLGETEVVSAGDLREAGRLADDYGARLIIVGEQETTEMRDIRTPILQITLPDPQQWSNELGVQAFLAKPVGREELRRTLESLAPHARRLLVVDDDMRFAEFMQRILKACDPEYGIDTAYSGESALSALAETRYDVCFLDYRLADTNGLALCAAIRGIPHNAETPIILVTALDIENLIQSPRMTFSLMLPSTTGASDRQRLTRAIIEQLRPTLPTRLDVEPAKA